MMLTWKRLGFPALLAAAMLSSSSPQVAAQDDKISPTKPGNKNSDDTGAKTASEDLAEQIRRLSAALGRLEKIELDMKDTQTQNALVVSKLQQDIAELQRRIDSMQRDMAAMSAQLNAVQSTSRKPAETAPSLVGKLRLVNTYFAEMAVVVNNSAYRLAPGQQIDLQLPAGSFTYQVLDVHAVPQVRQLSANETFKVTVQPATP